MDYYEVVSDGNPHKFQTINERAAHKEKSRRKRNGEHARVEKHRVNNELSKMKGELSK